MTVSRSAPLMYVHPGPLTSVGGQTHLPARTVTALREYASQWDGPVVLTGHGVQEGVPSPEEQSIAEETTFTIASAETVEDAVRSTNPGALLALHHPTSTDLLTMGKPVVLTAEFTRPIRADITIAGAEAGGAVHRARIVAGSWRAERTYRWMARRAAGIQANGPAAWSVYGRHHSRGLIFHDSRITIADVTEACSFDRNGESTFRVAFSGRLIRNKGAHLLVSIAREVARLAPAVEIVVLGVGPFENAIRESNPGNILLLGFKDFRTEWLPYVRSHVDLMLLPHMQGDPSCTYFESWGSGAPVVGFNNQTLTPVVRSHGCGWTVRRGDTSGLAAHVAQLSQRPAEYVEARARGLEFMSTHAFETESRRRVEMLSAVANS